MQLNTLMLNGAFCGYIRDHLDLFHYCYLSKKMFKIQRLITKTNQCCKIELYNKRP